MDKLLYHIQSGDIKSIARSISMVENDAPGYLQLLEKIKPSNTPVIGITGAPGTGKSTLTDALLYSFISQHKKVAVLCVDPSSPFNTGALLGDRIRMSSWYNHPDVFIRSLASRGSLGGLSSKMIEITDVMKAAPFDAIIVETVGVGQNEIEIAGLADITIVVLIPSSGDEIQNMKAGIMEIADLFVLNKADLPGADLFLKNLKLSLRSALKEFDENKIIKTIATKNEGIDELKEKIFKYLESENTNDRKLWLLTEKLYHLVMLKKMRPVNKQEMYKAVKLSYENGNTNLYQLAANY